MTGLVFPLAHAFGQRYDLPVPLFLFIFGGAAVVFISFLVVLPRAVAPAREAELPRGQDGASSLHAPVRQGIACVVTAGLMVVGWIGSQEVAENILPTLFWLVVWIAVPISCGVLGNWTRPVNPFAAVAQLCDRPRIRSVILGDSRALDWPRWLGWWPAAALFFVVACGELIYNATATLPAVTATGLAVYAVISALAGLVFGADAWLRSGELFSVLFDTWGRLGWFRFGAPGRRGFGGGLEEPFEPRVSRVTFVLLLLVSVSFDGLLSTNAWKTLRTSLPAGIAPGTTGYLILSTAAFAVLVLLAWALFGGFAAAVRASGRLRGSLPQIVSGLLVSLLPISFGYLVAHNAEYLAINGQLLIPLLGNPPGFEGVQLLPAPFNDSYVVNPNLLPSSVVWYFQVALIIFVHVAAVILAHRYLGRKATTPVLARRSEWPWIFAMVGYTMTSLWLLAQPIVSEAVAKPPTALRIGAVFPLTGSTAALAHEEYMGAQIAADLVNAAGGVDGKQISLDVRDVDNEADVSAAVQSLARDRVPAILGAYSSELSIPLSAATAQRGLVYWETGAVADRLTGRGLPLVFRVGADGAELGGNSGTFVLQQIAPRLHLPAASLRVYLVTADDDYAHSVANAARSVLTASGASIAGESMYDPSAPQWDPVVAAIGRTSPNILILSSHIPDGISFRRAFLAAHLHVDAFIGSTMAQCLPDFGDALGEQAVGVFASDRPEDDFNASALSGPARDLYARFATAWHERTGRAPSEEAIAGFSSAWALFDQVLPQASSLQSEAIATAARSLDLPDGSLPNGAGLRFASSGPRMGQNLRAAAVIWQWQAVRHSVVVWPPAYSTGTIRMVPLPA